MNSVCCVQYNKKKQSLREMIKLNLLTDDCKIRSEKLDFKKYTLHISRYQISSVILTIVVVVGANSLKLTAS